MKTKIDVLIFIIVTGIVLMIACTKDLDIRSE